MRAFILLGIGLAVAYWGYSSRHPTTVTSPVARSSVNPCKDAGLVHYNAEQCGRVLAYGRSKGIPADTWLAWLRNEDDRQLCLETGQGRVYCEKTFPPTVLVH
jgi:hypothetical protein